MNITEFLKTRKFWSPIIALIVTILTWAVPKYLGIEITADMLSIITTILWALAALVVYGDIKYDWNDQEIQKIVERAKG